MKIPVYGHEAYYEIDENGIVYSKKTKSVFQPLKASKEEKRYKLAPDKKTYPGKFLTYKSFFPDFDESNNYIVFKNNDTFDCSLNNLEIIDISNKKGIEKYLEQIYKEVFINLKENNHYYISNKGTLVSFYKVPKIINPSIDNYGYYNVKLSCNNILKHFRIHQLVARYFIENKDEKDCVRHIDGNKLNNSIENLEWCDKKYNNEHAIGIGLNHIGKKKKCCMIDCSTNQIIEVFDSISELALNYSVDGSTVSKQCRGIKNRFNNGLKARLFDEKNNSFVSTKFD